MNFRTFKIFVLLTAALLAATVQGVLAADRPITDAQLRVLTALVASRGEAVDIGKRITDSLGITKSSEAPMILPAIAVKDGEGVVHQLQVLSGARGYILGRVPPEPASKLVYWADNTLELTAAVVKASDQPPNKISTNAALAGFNDELALFARLANKVRNTEKK